MKRKILNFYYYLWSLIHPCRVGFSEYEHNHEWIDDSFDHEYGTQQCGHWECDNCGDCGLDEGPPTYEPFDY